MPANLSIANQARCGFASGHHWTGNHHVKLISNYDRLPKPVTEMRLLALAAIILDRAASLAATHNSLQEFIMRLAPLPPGELTAEQRPFYDDMRAVVSAHFKGFTWERGDGALVGPFNVMLHTPAWGRAAWDYTKAMIAHTTLPKPVHEIIILVTGARFGSRYELYAHEHVADAVGLAPAKIATIVAGERPGNLTVPEGVAYDTAGALCRGGPLPQATYNAAVGAFGKDGMAEIAYLVAHYCVVSVLLNAYDSPVPNSDGSPM